MRMSRALVIDDGAAGESCSGSEAPMLVLGLCGRLGTGKDTVADILEAKHGFRRASFARALKDVVAAAFGWDRDLLEGRTAESRAWREQRDPFWSTALDIPELTPRRALQVLGTDLVRERFHADFWLWALSQGIKQGKYGRRVVITDCRFENEVAMVRGFGGTVVCVQRGSPPEWERALRAEGAAPPADVHQSEWAWMGSEDRSLDNNGTLDDLDKTICGMVGALASPSTAADGGVLE